MSFKPCPAGLSPRAGPVIPVTLLWFGPGSPLSGPLGLAAERGHQPLLQTKILLTFSSTPPPPQIKTRRQKRGSNEGDKKNEKKERRENFLSFLSELPATSQPSLPLPQLLLRTREARLRTGSHSSRETREKADLYSHTVRSIFPSIPFHSAATQVCSGPAVFPQVSNITERGKKFSLHSSGPG